MTLAAQRLSRQVEPTTPSDESFLKREVDTEYLGKLDADLKKQYKILAKRQKRLQNLKSEMFEDHSAR